MTQLSLRLRPAIAQWPEGFAVVSCIPRTRPLGHYVAAHSEYAQMNAIGTCMLVRGSEEGLQWLVGHGFWQTLAAGRFPHDLTNEFYLASRRPLGLDGKIKQL